MTTTIQWIPVAQDRPDDERTVLIADADSDVTLGFIDGETGWRYCDGGRVTTPTTHWADLPAPPTA